MAQAFFQIGHCSREVQQKRFEICRNCGYNDLGVCSACECCIGFKIRLADQSCPDGQWHTADTSTESHQVHT